MGNPVVHFEIMGGDGEKLKSFYSDLFGWKIDSNNPMNYGMVETGGDGGINGGVGDGENFSGTRVYIAVPDLQEALDKIEAAGGKTILPPQELPMVTLALFEDPEGNKVGLVKG
jgi:predicted enzyme related to lactoylglutathione lyase